ncbi:hypothetical protein [Phormidium tenue]|uniref:Uncharacterized protein n=1 Tax=Phormidium tenue NIES-30 TaxID=549789 RepID=A0A1U7J2D5_9CYAN|nr:hypothetical protein [Phormidium tenue FACHB-1052]OKH46208.1 hypothetical protein NIES30_17500 [Phormidium tenue NIES-30]
MQNGASNRRINRTYIDTLFGYED